MNIRDFIKTGLSGTLGLMSISVFGRTGTNLIKKSKEFTLPELPYAFDALEPHFDKETMEIHYSRHHAGYTAKFNEALKKAGIEAESVRSIMKEASKYNADIINNGGGYLNHKIFWKCLSPKGGGLPEGKIAGAIEKEFGSFEYFREQFNAAARSVFGSGWAWLILQNNKLKVVTTANQDNPLMDTLPAENRGIPLLCIDVWEHAYYLKYQNRRTDYIDAFWNIVNWELVNIKFEKNMHA